jgi:dihydropteroate synthase
MGVVNVTPDSFSDGGRFLDEAAAVSHALALLEQGADILDVGGESTRPGAEPVSAEDEIGRVVPVVRAIRTRTAAPISVDTMKPQVMRAAAAAGADIWNDVSALGGPEALATAAELGCEVVLMHMQGEPRTMQADPRYEDVATEVFAYLAERAEAAISAGVARERIRLDPGIGFGKTVRHNLALIRNLDRLAALGFPVLLGVSRKRSIQSIDPTAVEPTDRLGGSLALALYGAAKGAAILRVHDVRETAQAVKLWAAVENDESLQAGRESSYLPR